MQPRELHSASFLKKLLIHSLPRKYHGRPIGSGRIKTHFDRKQYALVLLKKVSLFSSSFCKNLVFVIYSICHHFFVIIYILEQSINCIHSTLLEPTVRAADVASGLRILKLTSYIFHTLYVTKHPYIILRFFFVSEYQSRCRAVVSDSNTN